ncbi:MAG: cystathionine gamma-synthase [Anaerolineae bacterium]
MADHHFETLAVHAGRAPDPSTGSLVTPIYQTVTFEMQDVGVHRGYEYSRTANPTRAALERALAALEGGAFGLAFASGMAAIDAAARLLEPGDHVLGCTDLYGGTHRLFSHLFAHYGIAFEYVDLTDPDQVATALRPNTRLVWLESPTNPHLRLVDIAAVAQLLRQKPGRRALLAVDNTFATPAFQNPLTLGADLVAHSTTKYLSGHNDVVGGALVGNDPALRERLAFIQNAAGAIQAPFDSFLILRGLQTLPLRMRWHEASALAIATFLEGHRAVERVLYPGLASHPQHELARRQMRGFGAMISFRLKGGATAARRLVNSVGLITLAESLGGPSTLIGQPSGMSHASLAGTDLAIEDSLVRLSVGLEHPDDLIADLEAALEAAAG